MIIDFILLAAPTSTLNFTTEDLLKLIMFLLGSGFFGWKLIEKLIESYNKRKEKKADLSELKQKTEIEQSQILQQAEIEKEKSFQEDIINMIFKEYVTQNKWVTENFSSKVEDLIRNLSEQQKMNKDIYTEIDILRKELRQYEKESKVVFTKLQTLVEVILKQQESLLKK